MNSAPVEGEDDDLKIASYNHIRFPVFQHVRFGPLTGCFLKDKCL